MVAHGCRGRAKMTAFPLEADIERSPKADVPAPGSAVQLRVQLACSYVQLSVSATPCLPLAELHACTRAARSAAGIGLSCTQAKTLGTVLDRNEKSTGWVRWETNRQSTLRECWPVD